MIQDPNEIDEKRQLNIENVIPIMQIDEPVQLDEEKSVCLPDSNAGEDVKKTSSLKSKAESKIDALGSRIGNRSLVLMTVILIILLLLMLIIFASWPRLPHHLMAPKCYKPHCLRAAAMFVDKMNESSNPCTDPWEWACGQWLRRNSTVARGNWLMKDELRLNELTKIRDAISAMSDVAKPDSPTWKVKTLYESCMNLDEIESDHIYPLKKLIHEIGGLWTEDIPHMTLRENGLTELDALQLSSGSSLRKSSAQAQDGEPLGNLMRKTCGLMYSPR